MDYENIILEREGKVAIIRLNAPEVLNALSSDMVAEIHHAVVKVIASDARCLLITGEGRAFCAGANLQARGGDHAHGLPLLKRRKAEVIVTSFSQFMDRKGKGA